ncbi:hypothetical protein LIER_02625 [Lithospermum erythrorhizon]|uniref:Uncharacterized protein n=1 Tax=Lithospermum erythrorhizon TaxID=34254 RepID=A0AAV3NRC2_LITER
MSSSRKRTHSLDTDEVDDNDDSNFKHIRTKEPAVADGLPIEGDLLPGNENLNVVEAVQDCDLGYQSSCYGDSGDVKEVEALEKKEQDIRISLDQDRKTLATTQTLTKASTLEKDISSLQQAKLMSKEEENRFQQMQMDLESKKQELDIFKIVF